MKDDIKIGTKITNHGKTYKWNGDAYLFEPDDPLDIREILSYREGIESMYKLVNILMANSDTK